MTTAKRYHPQQDTQCLGALRQGTGVFELGDDLQQRDETPRRFSTTLPSVLLLVLR